jgi:Na+-transporting NADH:ubiquinone oxidoreductase subunit NqrB
MYQIHLFKDPRHFQILFQSSFLIYGIVFLHWSSPLWIYAAYFITGIVMHTSCEAGFTSKQLPVFSNKWWAKWWMGMPSALISSYGLCLFLKTNTPEVAISASAIAILSKYVIRINGKHLFNPSALGIVLAVLWSGKAWINPGQWGSGAFLLAGILTVGVIVVTKVQKLDVSLAFLGTYAILLFSRQALYLNWPIDFFTQTISTGAVLVFSFFMISDPKTTPNHPVARIIWAMMVASIAFYMTSFRYIVGAPVFALVLSQMLVPLFDQLFLGTNFQWKYFTASTLKPARS